MHLPMKVATEQRVPLVACLAGSTELREPFNRYAFQLAAAIPLESNSDHARIVDAIAKANLDPVFNHGSYGLYMNVINPVAGFIPAAGARHRQVSRA